MEPRRGKLAVRADAARPSCCLLSSCRRQQSAARAGALPTHSPALPASPYTGGAHGAVGRTTGSEHWGTHHILPKSVQLWSTQPRPTPCAPGHRALLHPSAAALSRSWGQAQSPATTATCRRSAAANTLSLQRALIVDESNVSKKIIKYLT